MKKLTTFIPTIATFCVLSLFATNGYVGAESSNGWAGVGNFEVPTYTPGGGGAGDPTAKLWIHFIYDGKSKESDTSLYSNRTWHVPENTRSGNLPVIDGMCARKDAGFWMLSYSTNGGYSDVSSYDVVTIEKDKRYYEGGPIFEKASPLYSALKGHGLASTSSISRNGLNYRYLTTSKTVGDQAVEPVLWGGGGKEWYEYALYRNGVESGGYAPYITLDFKNNNTGITYQVDRPRENPIINRTQYLFHYYGADKTNGKMYLMYKSDRIAYNEDEVLEAFVIYAKKLPENKRNDRIKGLLSTCGNSTNTRACLDKAKEVMIQPENDANKGGVYAFCSFEGLNEVESEVLSQTKIDIQDANESSYGSAKSSWNKNDGKPNGAGDRSGNPIIVREAEVVAKGSFEYQRKQVEENPAITFNATEKIGDTVVGDNVAYTINQGHYGTSDNQSKKASYTQKYTLTEGVAKQICATTSHAEKVKNSTPQEQIGSTGSSACIWVKYVPYVGKVDSQSAVKVEVNYGSNGSNSYFNYGTVISKINKGTPLDGIEDTIDGIDPGLNIKLTWMHELAITSVWDDGTLLKNNNGTNKLVGNFKVPFSGTPNAFAEPGLSIPCTGSCTSWTPPYGKVSENEDEASTIKWNIANMPMLVDNDDGGLSSTKLEYLKDELTLWPGQTATRTKYIYHPEKVKSGGGNYSGKEYSAASVNLQANYITCGLNGEEIGGNGDKAINYGRASLITNNGLKLARAGEGTSGSDVSTVWLTPENRIRFQFDACFGRQIAWDIDWMDGGRAGTEPNDVFNITFNRSKATSPSDNGSQFYDSSNPTSNKLGINSTNGKGIAALEVGNSPENRLDEDYQITDLKSYGNSAKGKPNLRDINGYLGETIGSTMKVPNSYGGTSDEYLTVSAKIPYNYYLDPGFTNFSSNKIGAGAGVTTVNLDDANLIKKRTNKQVDANYSTPIKPDTKAFFRSFVVGEDVSAKQIFENNNVKEYKIEDGALGNEKDYLFDGSADDANTIVGYFFEGATVDVKDWSGSNAVNKSVTIDRSGLKVGQKICVMAGVWPADSHNTPKEGMTGSNKYVIDDGNQTDALYYENTANRKWRIAVSCATTVKTPLASVEGHNLQTGGESKSSVYVSNDKILGSWSEYGVFSARSNFGSGASFAYNSAQNSMNVADSNAGYPKASTDRDNKIHPQSLGNYSPSGTAEPKDAYDNFASISNTGDVGMKLDYVESRVSKLRTHYRTYLGEEKAETTYKATSWNDFLNPSSDLIEPENGKKKDTIVYVAGSDSSWGDLRISNADYASYEDVQRIIFAKNIYIDTNVSKVKAILVVGDSNDDGDTIGQANGLLDTCSEAYVPDTAKDYDFFYEGANRFKKSDDTIDDITGRKRHIIDSSKCNNQLTINGMVIANRVNLDRTFGAGGDGDDPNALSADKLNVRAEIFNYTPETVIWAYNSTVGEGVLQNTVLEELSTRY